MSGKADGVVKFKIKIAAGGATPAPPVGSALGQRGVNIKMFCDQFNNYCRENMAEFSGMPVICLVVVNKDKSFSIKVNFPVMSVMIMKYANVKKGSSNPGKEFAGSIKKADLMKVAEIKLKDTNAHDIDCVYKMAKGTAISMGLRVVE